VLEHVERHLECRPRVERESEHAGRALTLSVAVSHFNAIVVALLWSVDQVPGDFSSTNSLP